MHYRGLQVFEHHRGINLVVTENKKKCVSSYFSFSRATILMFDVYVPVVQEKKYS